MLDDLRKVYKHTLPEIKNNNTASMWDKINLRKNNYTKSDDPMAQNKLDIVSKKITMKDAKVLNIGFGSGNLERIVYASNKNISYWLGVDISTKSVKRARKLFPKYLFKLDNIHNLRYKANSFDYIIILEVLEHISSQRILKVFDQIVTILKPHGQIIISVPLNEPLENMIRNKINYNEHVRMYTPDLLKAELMLSKLNVVEEYTLIAFNKLYKLKTFIVRYILPNIRQANNYIVIAQKP